MLLFMLSLTIIVFSLIVIAGTIFHHAWSTRDWKLIGLLAGYHLFLLYAGIFYSLLSS